MAPRTPQATGTWPNLLSRLPLLAAAAYRRWCTSLPRRESTADPVGTTLRELSLDDFEALVVEVFRKRGYQVREGATGYTGGRREVLLTRADEHPTAPLSPADSPVTSRSRGVVQLGFPASRGTPPSSAVVHIRYWQAWRIGATEVGELMAAVAARGAECGFLVAPGAFTRDARRMAKDNSIETIDGVCLRALVQTAQGGPQAPMSAGGIRPLAGLARALRSAYRRFGPMRGLVCRRRAAAAGPGPKRPVQIPLRHTLQLIGVLLAAAAIVGGFDWITGLPDKRLAPAERPKPAPAPAPEASTRLIAEPQAPLTPAGVPPAPPPPPGLGGFRSVHELDAAFEAFYAPPPGCTDPASHADMVECANHRIRARRGYMAAGSPAEPEMVQEAQEGQDGDLAWDQEAAIDALVLPHSGQPNPDAAHWETDDAPAPAPVATLVPRKQVQKEPEATYAPYDPKAPWVEP
jgi:hypothetical protein